MVRETTRERTHLPQKIFIALSGGTTAQTFEVRERFDNQTLRLSKKKMILTEKRVRCWDTVQ